MSETKLDILQTRINKKYNVNMEDVAIAFGNVKEELRAGWLKDNPGKTAEDFEKTNQYRKIQEQVRKQLGEVAILQKERDSAKGKALDTAHEAERKMRYRTAREYGWNITDPDRPGAEIDDYEGWGDKNKYGFGRTALAGYLVGLQFENPQKASEVFATAKKKFEKWHGSNLSDDEVKEIIGDNYLTQVNWLNISNETKGLLAAYLRLADGRLSGDTEKRAYSDYLFPKVDKALLELPRFEHTDSRWEMAKIYKSGGRAAAELDGLETLLSPAEWLAASKTAAEKPAAGVVEAPLPGMAKAPSTPAVETSTAQAGGSAWQSAAEEASGEGAASGAAGTASGKDKEAQSFAPNKKPKEKDQTGLPEGEDPYKEHWTEAKTVTGAFEGYDGKLRVKLALDHSMNLRDVNDGTVRKTLEAGEEVTLVDPQEKAKKVDGAIFVKINHNGQEYYAHEANLEKTGKDISDEQIDKEQQDFLKEKKMTVARQEEKYLYTMEEQGYKIEDRRFVFGFGNADIDNLFGEKTRKYLGKMLEKKVSLKDEAKAEKLADENKDAAVPRDVFINELLLETYLKQLNPWDKAKWDDVNRIMHQARKDALLTFPKKPSLQELQDVYNEKFVSAWRKAGKKLDDLADEESETAPGLEFLGTIKSEYRDALERIWKDKDMAEGALFHLPFNKTALECSLKKDERDEYVLGYRNLMGAERLRFATVEKAMEAINSGEVFKKMTWDMLRDKHYYKLYEGKIGDLNDLKVTAADEKTGQQTVKMELDWKGPTFLGGGNADVWAKVLPHGQIEFRVSRDRVGAMGENFFSGKAANFDDFMLQLAGLKSRAES